MNENSIDNSFRKTIAKSKLTSLSSELLEISIDTFIDNEFLKSIPFVNIAIGLYDATNKIQSYSLTKKILHFLNEFNSISEKEKTKLFEKIDNNDRYSKDFGERLLLIIENLNSIEKSIILGKSIKLLCQDKLNINDFFKLSHILNRGFLDDLMLIKDLSKTEECDKESFFNLGLLSMRPKMIENGMSGYEVRKRLNQTEYFINKTGEQMKMVLENYDIPSLK